MESTPPISPSDVPEFSNLPPGYQQVLSWKISSKMGRLVLMQILMVPLLIACAVPFFFLASYGTGGTVTGDFSAGFLVLIIVAALLTLVLHELVHGVAIWAYGGRPKFGILWKAGAFYATADGYAFPRNQYLVIALAPLVVLSLLFVPLLLLTSGSPLAYALALAATLNAAGAIGDLWISAITLRYPSQAYVVDEKDGMRVFLPAEL